jgi:hypothetical protein
VTDLIAEDNEEVRLEIMALIQKVNRKAVSNAQKVNILIKWKMLGSMYLLLWRDILV